jgi:O-antigen ligase
MSKLVHNDYLEQASDSGIPGFLAYTAFIVGALFHAMPRGSPGEVRPGRAGPAEHRKAPNSRRQGLATSTLVPPGGDWLPFAVWLGLLGWGLQGFVEFGLYLPGLSWPAFALLGWLVGRNPIDNPAVAR